jgi:hypothetical protein
MRELTSDRLGHWTRGAGLVAVVAVAWTVYVPGENFWAAVLAAGLIVSAVATAVLVRSRSIPSLAQVIASAEAEPAVVPARSGRPSGAGTRPSPRGGRRP